MSHFFALELVLLVISHALGTLANKHFTDVIHVDGLPGKDASIDLATLQPKKFYVRNNLDGDIEFRESPNISVDVHISGQADDKERYKVYYNLLDNDTLVDIQVYMEPEQVNWPLIGGLAGAGLVLILLIIVTICFFKNRRDKNVKEREEQIEMDRMDKGKNIRDKLQTFERKRQESEGLDTESVTTSLLLKETDRPRSKLIEDRMEAFETPSSEQEAKQQATSHGSKAEGDDETDDKKAKRKEKKEDKKMKMKDGKEDKKAAKAKDKPLEKNAKATEEKHDKNKKAIESTQNKTPKNQKPPKRKVLESPETKQKNELTKSNKNSEAKDHEPHTKTEAPSRQSPSVRTGNVAVKDRAKVFEHQQVTEPQSLGPSRSPQPRKPNKLTTGLLLLSLFAVAMAASTLSRPRARIVIQVPSRLVKTGSKIFFSEKHHGKLLVPRNWRGVFKQFAVSEATSVVQTTAPCALTCKYACDAHSSSCICYRGFKMEGRICKDIDECGSGHHNCYKNATCKNTVGSYICTCPEGLWGDGVKCKPCTTNKPCPENFYESAKCTRTRDRVCTACSSKCEKTTYQLYGCGLTFDRKCVDISKPLTKAKKGNITELIKTRIGAKVLVPKSANVLMENRLRVKSTNETFLANDGTTPNFTLHRNSGFLVDAEMLQVHLTPKYKDYNGDKGHENPSITSLNGFNEVRSRFCRYPAPNYYTLENRMHVKRQTMVKSAICQQQTPDLCPTDTAIGEKYHYRTVNNECHLAERNAICATGGNCKLPEPNENLYCTHYISILNDLFGRSQGQFTDTPLYVFSSRDCRASFRTCKECRQRNCSSCVEGSLDKSDSCSCCFKSCILPCGDFYSEKCGSKREPRKCAKGDTSELKLTHKYSNNLRLNFNCYLENDHPRNLYTLRYRVRDVKGRFTSSWMTTTLETSKLGGDLQKALEKGTHILDFLEITHDTNIKIAKGIYIRAERSSISDSFRYRTTEMGKARSSFQRGTAAKRIQPVTPFSIHVIGGSWKNRGTCNRLSTWSKIIRSDFTDFESPEVKHLGTGSSGAVGYEVFNRTNPPKFMVKISDQKSVLKFINNNSTVVNDKSFRSSIRRSNSSWLVYMSGKLSNCPSVIGLKVIDEIDHIKVIESDLIVLCPDKKFSLKLVVPRKGPDDRERLFSVYLTDSQQEYKLQVAIVDKTSRRNNLGFGENDSDKRREPWLVLMPLLVTTGCVILTLIALMIYAQKTAPKPVKMEKASASGWVWVKDSGNGKGKDPNRLKRRHMILVVFVVVVRVVYSLVFSLSMAFAILTLLHAGNMKIIGDYRNFVQRKIDQSKAIALRMDQFRETESKAAVDGAADVQRSCDYFLGLQLKWLQVNMSCSLQNNHMTMFNKLTEKVIDKVTSEVNTLERKVKAKVKDFSDTTKQSIKSLKEDVERYGRRVFHNGWFVLPKAVYEIKRKIGRKKREIGADYMQISEEIDVQLAMEREHQMHNLVGGLRVLSRMKRSFSESKLVGFLDYVGAVDRQRVAVLEKSINDKLTSIKAGFVDFKQAMASGKPPSHPISTALLCPVRYMSKKARAGLKTAVKSICEKTQDGVQGSVHCASINISNFCSADDNDDIFGNATDLDSFSQRVYFEERSGVDSSQNISAANKSSVITAARGNKHYNVEKGDAIEEQIESQKEEKLRREGKLKNVTSIYDAEVFSTTRMVIIYVLAIIDTLLFVFRCMKTYQIAMKLMYGFEEIVEHDEYEFEKPTTKRRILNTLNRILDIMLKMFVKFIASIKNLQKKIVRTNFLPLVMVIAIAGVGFYLTIAIVFNVMNVTVIEELGGFRMISANLDSDLAFTNNALSDHVDFLNNHDMKRYKQSVGNTLEGYNAVLDDFNAAQKERFQDFTQRLCSFEKNASDCLPIHPVFPEISFSACIIPRFETPKFEEYNGTQYRYKLKYESKKYVDAVRDIFLDTLYFIIGVMIIFIVIGVFTVIVFFFLKSRGMVRIRYIHVYPTLPPEVLKEHGLAATALTEDDDSSKGSKDGINKLEIPEKIRQQDEKNAETKF